MKRALILCLMLSAPAMAGERPALLCGGVEPAWSLELGAEDAIFTAPDTPQIDYVVQHVATAEGRYWPEVITLLAPQDTAIALIRPMTCSDTMSDRSYDWMADLLTQRAGQPVALTGCCRAAPAR